MLLISPHSLFPQTLPTLPPQQRLAGKSSGKLLGSKTHMRNNYNVLFNSNVSLNTNSKQKPVQPSCLTTAGPDPVAPEVGNPRQSSPGRCVCAHRGCLRSERQGRPEQTPCLRREIQLPAKISLHLLQPCLSCIEIFQLSALKL